MATIKGKYADFTVEPAGGMYDVRVTMTGQRHESPMVATAYFTADEVEDIQAALTAALEVPFPEDG